MRVIPLDKIVANSEQKMDDTGREVLSLHKGQVFREIFKNEPVLRSTHQIARSAEDLNKLTETLSQLVGKFTLADNEETINKFNNSNTQRLLM